MAVDDTDTSLASSNRVLDASVIALAREIAQGIYELDEILGRFGYDGPQDPRWLALKSNRTFDSYLRSAILEWEAADSTSRRVKVKAGAATEVLIPTMVAMASDPGTTSSARVDAAKWLSGLAGFRESGAAGDGGNVFSLTINMGDGRQLSVAGRAPAAAPSGPVIEGTLADGSAGSDEDNT